MSVAPWIQAIDDLAVGLRKRCSDLEEEIARVSLCDPASAISAMTPIGIDAKDFDQPDFKLMLRSCEVAASRSRPIVLRVCKGVLDAEGYWSAERLPHGLRWNERRFEEFAASFCTWPSPMVAPCIRKLARELASLLKRLRDAGEYTRHAERILSGTNR
jgi:hypothetical protein